ncbi:MAG: FAD:protein FMN transferase [Rubritalea sp.]|uniref:FAD:protein FMN transferase n=1 Tax=Rubritalea sp. TaxID=2109375 RepID=UPI0032429AA9
MSVELYQIDVSLVGRIDIESYIHELELASSLYSDSSELSILNREKVLMNPSRLFLSLLEKAKILSERTLGYYQPAIHGAWSAMELDELSDEHVEAADMLNVEISGDRVTLGNPLTELSFNAIAQGYLTDRVAQYLRELDVNSAILYLGETYAVGSHPEGRQWSLAVMGTPKNGETDLVGTLQFADAGLAVSTHDATRKLLNPKQTGAITPNIVVAVVSEEGAAVADAFATAFAVAPQSDWLELQAKLSAGGASQVKIWVENELVFGH